MLAIWMTAIGLFVAADELAGFRPTNELGAPRGGRCDPQSQITRENCEIKARNCDQKFREMKLDLPEHYRVKCEPAELCSGAVQSAGQLLKGCAYAGLETLRETYDLVVAAGRELSKISDDQELGQRRRERQARLKAEDSRFRERVAGFSAQIAARCGAEPAVPDLPADFESRPPREQLRIAGERRPQLFKHRDYLHCRNRVLHELGFDPQADRDLMADFKKLVTEYFEAQDVRLTCYNSAGQGALMCHVLGAVAGGPAAAKAAAEIKKLTGVTFKGLDAERRLTTSGDDSVLTATRPGEADRTLPVAKADPAGPVTLSHQTARLANEYGIPVRYSDQVTAKDGIKEVNKPDGTREILLSDDLRSKPDVAAQTLRNVESRLQSQRLLQDQGFRADVVPLDGSPLAEPIPLIVDGHPRSEAARWVKNRAERHDVAVFVDDRAFTGDLATAEAFARRDDVFIRSEALRDFRAKEYLIGHELHHAVNYVKCQKSNDCGKLISFKSIETGGVRKPIGPASYPTEFRSDEISAFTSERAFTPQARAENLKLTSHLAELQLKYLDLALQKIRSGQVSLAGTRSPTVEINWGGQPIQVRLPSNYAYKTEVAARIHFEQMVRERIREIQNWEKAAGIRPP